MMRVLLVVLMLLPGLSGAALAVQPDEVLDNPVLEERAREISKGLRCPVCQNESIDESHANVARDLRLLVRERLVEGDTDAQVVDFVVARYGEYVLFQPTVTGANWLLYAAGPLMLLLALGIGIGFVRTRAKTAPDTGLSTEEEARLREILDK